MDLTQNSFAADSTGMGAKPNAQMQAVLDEFTILGPKPLGSLPAIEARKQPSPADAVKALLKKQGKSVEPEAVGKVENKTIAGAAGQIPIRIYTPKGQGPYPVIVYYHGGGWVIADLDTYDASPRALVNATNAVVVSAHYRQAPEYKFPSAHDDALEAYKWVLEHAKELNGDPKRIALVGESAGGNMAAAVSVMAREHKMQMPIYQVLVYPIAGDNVKTASYIENAKSKPLDRAGMQWFFKQYLNSPADGKNHLISLLSEKDLTGLPPTTIITAQIDPLRSEGKAYADLLQKAGIIVRYKNYEGVTHEFFGMGAVVDKAKEAQQFVAEGLNEAFKGSK
ncbi:MAG: alpha/beta hydrolase [Bdellovibrio sp.]|nr:alpha/beta hydrolase [Methylotenera sp.]